LPHQETMDLDDVLLDACYATENVEVKCARCSPDVEVPITLFHSIEGEPPPFLFLQINRKTKLKTKHLGQVNCPVFLPLKIGDTTFRYRRKSVILHLLSTKFTPPYDRTNCGRQNNEITTKHYISIRDLETSFLIHNDAVTTESKNLNLIRECGRMIVGAMYDLEINPEPIENICSFFQFSGIFLKI